LDFSRFTAPSFGDLARLLVLRFLGPSVRLVGPNLNRAPEGAAARLPHGLLLPAEAKSPVALVAYKMPSSDPAADAEWLANFVREALEPYIDPDTEQTPGDYYILVTNLPGLPADLEARRSHPLTEVFEAYAEPLGYEGWQVWGVEELIHKLAEADDIRRAFAAWLIPTDPLSTVMGELDLGRPDFGTVIHRFLQKEIRAQRPTRLQQAGHGGGDTATNLEDVFVDLPCQAPTPFEDNENGELLLARLLRRIDRKLNLGWASGEGPRPERLLLLGGPGQGKSTMTQLFAQFLRASLLRAEVGRPPSVEARQALNSVLSRTSEAGLRDTCPRRFPIRIDLPVFADALATARKAERSLSLLGYVRDYIAGVADAPELALSDLRAWIGGYPSVFMLDGLDEVPPSANRSDVITAINDLWDEIASLDADVLMIVTTRPQGYNDDLDPRLYGRLEMSRLATEHVLAYAAKLAKHRLPDLTQRKRVLERMKEAASTPTTAHLLVSPLQVAIMLALIDRRGEAPSDRWTLFESYFNVVLEREQQKSGPTGRTVKTWARTIAALHQNIGFALHLQAETRGGSDAQLTRADLEGLVRDELELDGFEGVALDEALNELFQATTDRLVLLVQRVDQRYSFEVRSLQEFMAAAYLMSGPEAQVQARLREIADKSHWRHVFLIAASKCFSSNDTRHYRDTILQICDDLNVLDPTDVALKNGARLALALFEDGLAFDTPTWRKKLLLRALDLVQVDAASELTSLMSAARTDAASADFVLRPHLRSGVVRTRLGAWRMVLNLALEDSWAADMAVAEWPTDLDIQLEVISLSVKPGPETKLHGLYGKALRNAGFEQVADRLNTTEFTNGQTALDHFAVDYPALMLLSGLPNDSSEKVAIKLGGSASALSFCFLSVEMPPSLKHALDNAPSGNDWELAQLIGEFHKTPDANSLGLTLRRFTPETLRVARRHLTHLTVWPLRVPMQMACEGADLQDLAERAEAGAFGCLDSWRQAETRWIETGISEADLRHVLTVGLDHTIGAVGAPYPAGINLTHGVSDLSWLDMLLALQWETKPWAHGLISWLLNFTLSNYPQRHRLDIASVRTLVEGLGNNWMYPKTAISFSKEAQANVEIRTLIGAKGRAGEIWSNGSHRKRHQEIVGLLEGVDDHPDLLPFLVNTLGMQARSENQVTAAAAANLGHADQRVAAIANALTLVSSGGDVGSIAPVFAETRPRFALGHLLDAASAPDILKDPAATGIVLALVDELRDANTDGHERAMSALAKFADRRRSDLGAPICADRLGLRRSLCRLP
jgi:hypothetical protein